MSVWRLSFKLRPLSKSTSPLTKPWRANMASFHVPMTVNNEASMLPVYLDVSKSTQITMEELTSFPPFNTWLKTIAHSLSLQSGPDHPFHANPYVLGSISITSVTRFSSNIGFMTLNAKVHAKHSESTAGVPLKSETLPGSILLRGPAVAMLIILQPDDVNDDTEDDKHVLLTVQPRIPAASLAFTELPAGMVAGGAFKGAAAREIEEECNLKIAEQELIDLTALALNAGGSSNDRRNSQNHDISLSYEGETLHNAMYTSAGGQDEAIAIFMHQRRVPRGQLQGWTGRLTGLRNEGEKITLKCVRLENLWKEAARDSKALAAWALYEGLRKEGKV